MLIYIYKLTAPNDKNYIGQTRHLKTRLKVHLEAETLIGRALRKYSPINFKIEILWRTKNYKTANEFEILEIKRYKSLHPNGYNMTEGGNRPPSHLGIKRSKKTCKKISESNRHRKGEKRSKKAKIRIGIANLKRAVVKLEKELEK